MTIREKALAKFQKHRKEELGKATGFVQCPYCGKMLQWQQSVAVHYIPRAYRATEVEPMNVWAGCAGCNSRDQLESNNGEYHEAFRQWLIDNPQVRLEGVERLEGMKHKIVKHGKFFYETLIEELK